MVPLEDMGAIMALLEDTVDLVAMVELVELVDMEVLADIPKGNS